MFPKPSEQTYYELLEVSVQATPHEIQRAYKVARQTYSPDSPALYTMFSEAEASDLLKLVDEAYRVLSNPILRQEYDQKLSISSSPEEWPDFPVETPVPVKQTTNPSKAFHSKPDQPVPKTNTSAPVPEGFKRTRFSVYEVKEDFENEISTSMEFDGPFLQKIRLYKGVNLDQMSRETRISRSYLAAIETNDFEALPAPVFVRGFIIQVARLLGLNETKVANSFMSMLKKGRGEQ